MIHEGDRSLGNRLVGLWLVGMLVSLALVCYVFYSSYQGRQDLVNSQRAGCERSKLDRADNAEFQRAHARYIHRVTGAASVQEDVKRAAREAALTYERTSTSLTKRSRINCAQAFPKAGFFP